jgi:peptide/nickel transport system permease protein
MLRYVARRLSYAVLTFFGITVVVFALVHSVPGDPIDFLLGNSGTKGISKETLAEIRHANHLDQPLPAQYLWWLRGVVTLDFGNSILDHRKVTEKIAEKMPNTFVLNLLAFLVAGVIGIPIGLWSATKSGHPLERGTALTFFLLYSLPVFWVGLLLMRLFSVKLGWLPLLGMTSDEYLDLGFAARVADRLKHLLLPVVTLAYGQLAIYTRFSKSALAEVIRQDFITTARAKGVAPAGVIWNHALRNALIPLITLLGLTIPYLISGSVIVEQIFQWDGVGLLYYSSIQSRDYPTVLGLTVATAIVTLLASLLSDLLYAAADPRIRLEGRR